MRLLPLLLLSCAPVPPQTPPATCEALLRTHELVLADCVRVADEAVRQVSVCQGRVAK